MVYSAASEQSTTQMERRLHQLETLVQDLQLEIKALHSHLSQERNTRLEKMQNYQRELDHMFGVK